MSIKGVPGKQAEKSADELEAMRAKQEFADQQVNALLEGSSPPSKRNYLILCARRKFGKGYAGAAQEIEDYFTPKQAETYEAVKEDLMCWLEPGYSKREKEREQMKKGDAPQSAAPAAVPTSLSSPTLTASLSVPTLAHSSSSGALSSHELFFSDISASSSSRPASPSSKEADSAAKKPTSPFSPRNSRR